MLRHELIATDDEAFGDDDPADGLLLLTCAIGDMDSGIGGVGDETPLARVDSFEDALAGESIGVEQVKGAAIERQPARVVDPERAQNILFAGGPEGNFFSFDFRLQNRHDWSWFLPMVIFCLSLYSKLSPRPLASASGSSPSASPLTRIRSSSVFTVAVLAVTSTVSERCRPRGVRRSRSCDLRRGRSWLTGSA